MWRPEKTTRVLHLLGATRDVIASLPGCRTMIVSDRERGTHVLVERGDVQLQLFVLPSATRQSPAVILPTDLATARRTAALMITFAALASGAAVRRCARNSLSGRLTIVLQALDGNLAGATQREIAIALLGRARVERDWRDARGHLRDVVRRAIRRGRALMNGGYLKLLR